MQTVKIIHSADWHFDSALAGLPPSKAARRREEIMQTFEKMIKLAVESETKLVLIAGDFFDSDKVSPATLYALAAAFKSAPDIRFFISPGNHDPASAKECYEGAWFGDNVHIFRSGIESVHIPELGAVVYGAGFAAQRVSAPLLAGFKAPQNDLVNIMVLHGDLANESDYNPITMEQIENSGLDYLALGHRHNFEGIKSRGKTFYAYSGAPEGRGFDEMGDKGIIQGEVGAGGANLRFVPMAKRKYESLEIPVGGLTTQGQVLDKIKAKINSESVTKVVLTGSPAPGAQIFPEYLARELEDGVFFAKVADETRPTAAGDFDFSLLEGENLSEADMRAMANAGLRGAFALRLVEAAKNDPIAAAALKYGIFALEGRRLIHDE